jgi:hypothetical protein
MWRPPAWWVIAALVFSGAAAHFLRRRTLVSSILALGTIFVTGALSIQVRGGTSMNSPSPWSGNRDELLVTAHVTAEGNIQSDGTGAFHQRIDVETEKIEAGNQATEGRSGVRLNIYSQAKHADAQTTETSAMQLFH